MPDLETEDAWERLWTARLAALERVLGPSENTVGRAVIPLELGGAADVVHFREHIPGRVSATAGLIGSGQPPSAQGAYELMVCHRDDDDHGPNLVSQLARYTLEAVLEPGETMDIGPAAPQGSSIAAFLFVDYARFDVEGAPAGLLLCLGITKDELKLCRKGRHDAVLTQLRESGVYPYTDWTRLDTARAIARPSGIIARFFRTGRA